MFKELLVEFGIIMSEVICKMIEEKVYFNVFKKFFNLYGYEDDFLVLVYSGKK